MAPPRAPLRLALSAAALVFLWPAPSRASPDDPRPAAPAGPEPFNEVPTVIPAPDRSAIEEELSAVMTMTPPDRRVTAELPSGSRLSIRAGAYEPGPAGSDCRRFDYAYESIGGGTALVAGLRCKAPAALTWVPPMPDTLLEGFGLVPPAPPQTGPPSPPAPARPADAEPAGLPPRVEPARPAATATPPSRVILPFTPGR
jgi:hypothetical protein